MNNVRARPISETLWPGGATSRPRYPRCPLWKTTPATLRQTHPRPAFGADGSLQLSDPHLSGMHRSGCGDEVPVTTRSTRNTELEKYETMSTVLVSDGDSDLPSIANEIQNAIPENLTSLAQSEIRSGWAELWRSTRCGLPMGLIFGLIYGLCHRGVSARSCSTSDCLRLGPK